MESHNPPTPAWPWTNNDISCEEVYIECNCQSWQSSTCSEHSSCSELQQKRTKYTFSACCWHASLQRRSAFIGVWWWHWSCVALLSSSILWYKHGCMCTWQKEEGGLTQVAFWPQQLPLREATEKTDRKPAMGLWRCPDNWENCCVSYVDSYVDSLPDRPFNRYGWHVTKPTLLPIAALMLPSNVIAWQSCEECKVKKNVCFVLVFFFRRGVKTDVTIFCLWCYFFFHFDILGNNHRVLLCDYSQPFHTQHKR